MAEPWIKMRCNLADDEAVIGIASVLGLDEHTVVGKLHCLWSWVDRESRNGHVPCVTPAWVNRHVRADGFAEEMVEQGWLVFENGGITFPNFDEHMSGWAKKRADSAKRTAKHRRNADVTDTSYKRITIPRPLRRQILERDNQTCVYCGRKRGERAPQEMAQDAAIGLDHVIPVTQGGDITSLNLVACCNACNNAKNNRIPDEAGLNWPCDVTGKRYGSVTASTSISKSSSSIKGGVGGNAKPREPDPIWDTVEELYFGGHVVEGQKKRCGRLVRFLKSKGATAEEIRSRRQRLVDAWGAEKDTVNSLETHWDKFDGRGPVQARPGRAVAPAGKYKNR